MRFSSAAYGATLGLLQTRKNCEMFVAGSNVVLSYLSSSPSNGVRMQDRLPC